MTVFMAIASDPHTFKPSDVFQWNQWIPQKKKKKKVLKSFYISVYNHGNNTMKQYKILV